MSDMQATIEKAIEVRRLLEEIRVDMAKAHRKETFEALDHWTAAVDSVERFIGALHGVNIKIERVAK